MSQRSVCAVVEERGNKICSEGRAKKCKKIVPRNAVLIAENVAFAGGGGGGGLHNPLDSLTSCSTAWVAGRRGWLVRAQQSFAMGLRFPYAC